MISTTIGMSITERAPSSWHCGQSLKSRATSQSISQNQQWKYIFWILWLFSRGRSAYIWAVTLCWGVLLLKPEIFTRVLIIFFYTRIRTWYMIFYPEYFLLCSADRNSHARNVYIRKCYFRWTHREAFTTVRWLIKWCHRCQVPLEYLFVYTGVKWNHFRFHLAFPAKLHIYILLTNKDSFLLYFALWSEF